MKLFIIICCLAAALQLPAQELFTYSEPASNMPVKSIAIRSNNYLMRERAGGSYSYGTAPEVMLGLSKKLMVHGEAFFGIASRNFSFDGASLYLKYRFFSRDEVHSHFRMALYAKVAVANKLIEQSAIDLAGRNTGAEAGMVATKLMDRVALSAGASFVNAFNNSHRNKFSYPGQMRSAISYNIAAGKLLLPAVYKNYEQTNLNAMVEILGQTNAGSGETFVDFAPSLQLIFLSKIRLDAGYRFPVVHSLSRISDRSFLFRLEYNFFSVFR